MTPHPIPTPMSHLDTTSLRSIPGCLEQGGLEQGLRGKVEGRGGLVFVWAATDTSPVLVKSEVGGDEAWDGAEGARCFLFGQATGLPRPVPLTPCHPEGC